MVPVIHFFSVFFLFFYNLLSGDEILKVLSQINFVLFCYWNYAILKWFLKLYLLNFSRKFHITHIIFSIQYFNKVFFGYIFHFVDSFTWSISTINNVGQSVVLLTVYLHSNNYEIFTLSVIIIFNNNCKCICIHVCKYKLLFLNNNSHRTSIDECFVRNFKEKYLG